MSLKCTVFNGTMEDARDEMIQSIKQTLIENDYKNVNVCCCVNNHTNSKTYTITTDFLSVVLIANMHFHNHRLLDEMHVCHQHNTLCSLVNHNGLITSKAMVDIIKCYINSTFSVAHDDDDIN